MQAHRLAAVLTCVTCWLVCVAAAPRGLARPTATQRVDLGKRVNINDVNMAISNVGSFAYDYALADAGLEFPKGSHKTAVFSSGLWLSANIGSSNRLALSGYAEEFMAGSAVGGIDDDPSNPVYQVYELRRVYTSNAVRDSALAAWNLGAVTHGAPEVLVRPDGSLTITGDQMLWTVFNDLDAGNHQNPAGRTPPIGIEVQQTTFAFVAPGAFANTVFMRYKLINRTLFPLTDVRIGFWSDPDLGGAFDDLAGCDPAANLGYCYNASTPDAVYGSNPPAIGYDMVQGPSDANHNRLGLSSFSHFVNGADPDTSTETRNALHGLTIDSLVIINPLTAQATKFQFTGDPVAGTGWRETLPQDQRMLLTAGPVTMAPGDSQEVVIAIILAQGADALNSLALLRSYDAEIQSAWDIGGVLAVGDAPGVSLAMHRAFPNPSRGDVTLSFTLGGDGPATLELLDVAGRSVIKRDLGGMPAGRHDLRLGQGSERLAAGMYFARVIQRDHSATSRLVVLQ